MKKARIALAAGAVGAALAVPALTLSAAAATTPSASSGPLLTVCLTIAPKSIAISIDGLTLGNGAAGLPTTCISI